MARITIDDCLERMDNRFQLVLVAAKRARQIAMGGQPMIDPGDDKPTVIALREIAEGKVGREILDSVHARSHAQTPLISEESGA